MAYEEASVAGETPDRSKQRKSSGNPTGAEPSVPAPSPEERDPRLAVAREVPAAREDRATAVFSTKAVTESMAADSAESADAAGKSGSGDDAKDPAGAKGAKGAMGSEGSEGSGSSEGGEAEPQGGKGEGAESGKGEEKGDARLRAAVAAWVASADDEAPGSPDAGKPAEAAAPGAGKASSGDDATSAEEDETNSAAEESAPEEPSAGPAAKTAPAAEASADDAASDGDEPGETADAAGSAAAADAGSEPRDADEAAAADAMDATDDSRDAGAAAESAEIDESAESAESADADASEPADASEDPADAEDDPEAATDAGDDASGEPSDKTPEAPSRGVDQATAVFKALPPKTVDQPTTMLKLGDHKPGAKKPEGKSPEDQKPEDQKPGSANSKAGNTADAKPSAASAASATPAAASSATPTAKPSAKPSAKPAAEPAAKPEGAAERTSKFVALKPLDGPAPSGPVPPAKQAPGAKGATSAAASAPAAAPENASTAENAAGSVGPERTTQQPLPPRPPLDLLAELTNTPPPPETPVRTAVRRVKIWTPLVLLMVVVFAVVQAVRPLPTPTLALTAKETVTFEGDKPSIPWPSQGQAAMDVNGIGTFGSSGSQKPVPIASIAKVMTVYLVLRDHPLKKGGDPGPKIPVDAAAEKHYETGKAENESVVRVAEGQKITEYEALQAVMLPSANNIAKLLARWDTKSDSEDEFVAKMNKTAKELGMKNTHYTDPSGLDKTTVSTAADLVKLGRAAMEDPVFNEISRQPNYKDLNGDKQNNFFGLVPTVAIGIKTGTTTAAGGNILFAAEQKVGGETRTIIGAALGQYGKPGVANIDEVTGVTRKLIEAGQGALTSKKIVKKGDVVGEVDDGLGGTTPVVATKDVAAAGWSGLTVKLKLDDKAGDSIPHTAKAGTKVGVLSVGDGKEGAVEVPVALQKDLAEPGFGAKLTRVG
ncbi:D-alanyl-D-alanine carboxypeptidase [Streptomyces sp. NPDC055060]